MADQRLLTFLGHIEEMRVRIIRMTIVVLGMTGVTYMFTDKILGVIAKPAGHLIYISPIEGFVTYLKVAFWSALFLSSPYIFFEIWQFVGDAMGPRERRYILMLFPVSLALFTLGAWFGFYFVAYAGMQFLMSFGHDFMTPTLTVSNYVSFVSSMSLACGVVFQLPVVIGLLTKMGIVTPSFLSDKRRHAIVVIFIAAGILTPSPDIFSQLCMAVPLYVLYEVSIIVSRIIYQRNKSLASGLVAAGA